jgi:hypothetical protein
MDEKNKPVESWLFANNGDQNTSDLFREDHGKTGVKSTPKHRI